MNRKLFCDLLNLLRQKVKMGSNIIFICTSNVCRSPIAEGLAKKWLSDRYGIGVQDLEQAGYQVQSRGCSADFEPVGSPASAHGVTVMRDEYGVDIAPHRSAMLSPADMIEATHIYCMSQRHYDTVFSVSSNFHGLQPPPPSSTPPAACAIPATAGGDGCGLEKKTPPPPRGTPAVISMLTPEIPDPWHGTLEYYQSCTSMIKEAIEKALEEDMPVAVNQQQERKAKTQQQGEKDCPRSQS